MPPPPSFLLHPWCLHITRYLLSTLPHSLPSTPTAHTIIAHLNLNTLPDAPQVDAILHKWKEMGVSQPAVDRLSVTTIPAVWKKTALLLEEGLSPQQVAKMIDVSDAYSFLSVSYEKLAACLNFLKSLDVTGQNAGNILTKRFIYKKKVLLSYDLQMLKQKFDLFDELGLDRALRTKTLLVFPSVASLSSQRLGRLVEYLRGLGMDSETLHKVFSRFPRIFDYSVERTIEPTVSYLQSRGLSKEDTCRLFRLHPVCLTRSVDATRRKFERLERIGLQKPIFRAYFKLCRSSSEFIEARIEWLISQGFSRVEVCRMGSFQPSILSFSNQCLLKKLDFLVKVMKRDIKQIVACPSFLGCSLENRIKPRFNVLTKLEEKGTRHYQYSLYVFSMSEKTFVRRFVKPLQA